MVVLFLTFICFSADSFFCILIGLEGIMIWIYWGICASYFSGGLGLVFVVMFMGMMVIEGAIGISVLISSVGYFGEDYFFSMSVV